MRSSKLAFASRCSVSLSRTAGAELKCYAFSSTALRYRELNIGPELATRIEASGGTRDVQLLSVGTREQLSTVFRLSLAEELQSAALLDDQRTQTDSKRMNWFRQRLCEFAPKIQIVVLTCRPQDYLGKDEIPSGECYDGEHVGAINLEHVIERA